VKSGRQVPTFRIILFPPFSGKNINLLLHLNPECVYSGLIRAMVTYLSTVYRISFLRSRSHDNLEANIAISLYTYRLYFVT
jgi:hypothetical protein